jgi:fructose-1,6-bisphosphatase/sedoheptulose 1,7-bisphosphatase-like protein
MATNLRANIADQRLNYTGKHAEFVFDPDRIIEFNHRHKLALGNYDLSLDSCRILTLCDRVNPASNLGALRNRKLRQSVVLSAALSAAAVGLHGRGRLNEFPEAEQTKDLANQLKRANDRTAAQVMSEVLQTTTDSLPMGEEVLIESTITEGVRVKPGKEEGGNPTIAVGAVFGKKRDRDTYGLDYSRNITMLSMGSDVIDGTTKSIEGLHSSLTALFVTESNVKRHLPDIYVQRWMSGAPFRKFNPREVDVVDAAEIIRESYGFAKVDKLSAFFLDRPRHYPAMDALNAAGVSTPFDKDGDLMPAVILGMDGLTFPDGRGLTSMIGEIGGSAEWAVGVLPLVWRGGQALGMLTSQSSLTRKDLSPEEKWRERFHFTEDEFMLIQDARFERKPYFTIGDILEDPMAGGISAFGGITDSYYLPYMHGARGDSENKRMEASVLVVNSLGMVECWQMTFACQRSLEHSLELMFSPKERIEQLKGAELESAIGGMLADDRARERYRIFFANEYYPALIPVHDKTVLLHKALDSLIERGALAAVDRDIVNTTTRLAPEWFIVSD